MGLRKVWARGNIEAQGRQGSGGGGGGGSSSSGREATVPRG